MIEELDPLSNITLSVKADAPVAQVTLEPEGRAIPHTVRNGRVEIALDTFTCHQMIVLHEA